MKCFAALLFMIGGGAVFVQAQTPTDTTLPVYRIVGSGASEAQAVDLAKQLQIPSENLVKIHGSVFFVDQNKYLTTPRAAIPDTEVTRRLRDATKNKNPGMDIRLTAIDAQALGKLQVLDEKTALDAFAKALQVSGLQLESATPLAGHDTLTLYSRDRGGNWLAKATKLDTTVSYKFTMRGGYPLVGPGAQAQVTYDGEGRVSQLIYSVRSLKAGSQVKILSEAEARERIARKLPANARITMRLVYLSPPLEDWLGRAGGWQPTTILPWYAYYSTTTTAKPRKGLAQEVRSRVTFIPATDDPTYVPSVRLSTSSDGASVRARADVTGGTAPYTYIWGGSNAEVSRQNGESIEYTAQVRGTESLLRDGNFPLPTTETVSLTVIDANGVMIHAQQVVPIRPRVNLNSHGRTAGPSYGAESPADPGEWTACRVGWQKGMSTAGAGGGTESFAWLGDDAWPGDFIEPKPAGTLVATPWVNGDADYANWGINTADLVMDIADGNADLKTAMQPGAPLSQYATANLQTTALANDVGINLNGYGTPAWYTVNYAASWGPTGPNDTLEWLLLDDCDMLDPADGSGLNVAQRWGIAFNGLHVLTGFSSLDYGDGPFENTVANNILGVGGSPQTIVQSWFNAAQSTGAGTPAAMGPALAIGQGLFWMADIEDYYWGKGGVGSTILPANFPQGDIGFWYLNGSNSAALVFP